MPVMDRLWPLIRREALLIAVFVTFALVLLGVIHLGSEISEDGTSSFDSWLIVALRQPGNLGVPIGPAWLRQVFVDITALGGVPLLTLIVLVTAGYLVAAGRHRTALLILVATASGSLLGQVLKFAFARVRPQLVPHLVEISTLSFPSGHALNSAVTFLTLGALLARAEPARRVRGYILVVAMALTLLIGFSRVYVGVHWPTDVIAGWAIGGSWALLWWAMAVRLQQRDGFRTTA